MSSDGCRTSDSVAISVSCHGLLFGAAKATSLIVIKDVSLIMRCSRSEGIRRGLEP